MDDDREAPRVWHELRSRLDARSMPIPECGCIVWLGSCDSSGYGSIRVGDKTLSTHRLSYTVNKGPISPGKQVLHRCDVRPCINADHFFLGDNMMNAKDRSAKGRSVRLIGMDQGRAKLRDDQVRKILLDPRTHKAIAGDYGISVGPVAHIKHGIQWSHVTNGETDWRGTVRGESVGGSKLTEDQVQQILNDDRSQRRIAKDHNVCQMTVSLIKQRKIWRHVSP